MSAKREMARARWKLSVRDLDKDGRGSVGVQNESCVRQASTNLQFEIIGIEAWDRLRAEIQSDRRTAAEFRVNLSGRGCAQ